MNEIVLWHNPRCSKSRAALALLQDRGLSPEIRLYLETPPTIAELQAVVDMLGLPAARMTRLKELEARELGLAATDDDATLIAAMAATPRLIERPILLSRGRAAVGRPPEAILEIL